MGNKASSSRPLVQDSTGLKVDYEEDRSRLQQYLTSSETLLCVAPAKHINADASLYHRVWIGIARGNGTKGNYVFVFSRCRVAPLRRFFEALYCVIPVAKNIQVISAFDRCHFLWRSKDARRYRVGTTDVHSTFGDLFIEDIRDPSGQLLECLNNCYNAACEGGITFYKDDAPNHQAIWSYVEHVPLDVAKIYPATRAGPTRLRTSGVGTEQTDAPAPAVHELKALCMTWNVGATLPNRRRSLRGILSEVWNADVVAVGLQEVCALNARTLIKDDYTQFQAWRDWVEAEVTGFNPGMVLVETVHLVGMLLQVYMTSSLRQRVTGVGQASLGLGIGGVGGNKGAIGIRFELEDGSTVCIINSHMAAGQQHYLDRVKNFASITQRLRFFEGQSADNFNPGRLATTESPPAGSGKLLGTAKRSFSGNGGPSRRSLNSADSRSSKHQGRDSKDSIMGGLRRSITRAITRTAGRTMPGLGSKTQPAPVRTETEDWLDPTDAAVRGNVADMDFSSDGEGGEDVQSQREMHNDGCDPPTSCGVEDHSHVVWLGDLNSRLHWPGRLGGMPVARAVDLVRTKKWGKLLALDQLHMMQKDGLAFVDYDEHDICFLPSYKWRPDSHQLDMRSNKHVPAWCDRVLLRSKTRPRAEVTGYNASLELKQSDHRCVYASVVVPVKSRRGAAAEDDLFSEQMLSVKGQDASAPTVVFDTQRLEFKEVRTAVAQEATLVFRIEGGLGFSGRCMYTTRFKPVGAVRKSVEVQRASLSQQPNQALGCPDSWSLASSLSVSPAVGYIGACGAVELTISLNYRDFVLRPADVEAVLAVEISITSSGREGAYTFPVGASVVPSVMGMPLEFLSGLSVPLLSPEWLGKMKACDWDVQRAGFSGGPLRSQNKTVADLLGNAPAVAQAAPSAMAIDLKENTPPPKEVISVMKWVLEASAKAPKGEFEWWPDPPACEFGPGGDFAQVQRCVESGVDLSTCGGKGRYRGGVAVLLRWLFLLPCPIVGQHVLERSQAMGPAHALRIMMALPRNVLLCFGSLLQSVMARHGHCKAALQRTSLQLAQLADGTGAPTMGGRGGWEGARIAGESQRLLDHVMQQMERYSESFPPWEQMRECKADEINAEDDTNGGDETDHGNSESDDDSDVS